MGLCSGHVILHQNELDRLALHLLVRTMPYNLVELLRHRLQWSGKLGNGRRHGTHPLITVPSSHPCRRYDISPCQNGTSVPGGVYNLPSSGTWFQSNGGRSSTIDQSSRLIG